MVRSSPPLRVLASQLAAAVGALAVRALSIPPATLLGSIQSVLTQSQTLQTQQVLLPSNTLQGHHNHYQQQQQQQQQHVQQQLEQQVQQQHHQQQQQQHHNHQQQQQQFQQQLEQQVQQQHQQQQQQQHHYNHNQQQQHVQQQLEQQVQQQQHHHQQQQQQQQQQFHQELEQQQVQQHQEQQLQPLEPLAVATILYCWAAVAEAAASKQISVHADRRAAVADALKQSTLVAAVACSALTTNHPRLTNLACQTISRWCELGAAPAGLETRPDALDALSQALLHPETNAAASETLTLLFSVTLDKHHLPAVASLLQQLLQQLQQKVLPALANEQVVLGVRSHGEVVGKRLGEKAQVAFCALMGGAAAALLRPALQTGGQLLNLLQVGLGPGGGGMGHGGGEGGREGGEGAAGRGAGLAGWGWRGGEGGGGEEGRWREVRVGGREGRGGEGKEGRRADGGYGGERAAGWEGRG